MGSDRRVEELLARLLVWGEAQGDVRGIILFGSRARTTRPSDRWSDVDLLISCSDPAALLAGTNWLEQIGEARISFLETNPVDGEKERRALFANGLDVDFNFVQARRLRVLGFALGPMQWLVPRSQRREAGEGARALATIMRPGFRILLDKDGVLARVADLALRQPPLPSRERKLEEIASDFWYHAVWTAKKLRRGELWLAKGCCDSYLKNLVVEALSLGRERPGGLPSVRFIDETLDAETARLLRGSHAKYDRDDVARALMVTLDLFAKAVRQTSERLGLVIDEEEEAFAREQVARVLVETEGD